MPLTALLELLDRAIAARDDSGTAAIAERLLLYSPVVSALEQFTSREASRLVATRRVAVLSRELSTHLRHIEVAETEHGPTAEHVKAYYDCAVQLQHALRELQQSAATITIREILK